MIGAELESRYRIEAELGSGGVGSVYRATHLKLGRAVAIKVLRPEYGASAELLQRFQREAQALAALSHPNVVTVTDYGVVGDTPYLVMELLEGETLSERLKRGALDPGDALEVMRQLLAALAFVHDAGLVHRDVKPGNVFLQKVPGEKAHVRLLDFGLAKFLAPTGGGRPITRAGQIFGTPSYMSPEQVAGQEADARADVYAAGIILFEMLAGRTPFRGKTSDVMRLHLMEELPKIETVHPERAASPALWALLQKATAKTRAERFATVREFAAALDALEPPVVVAPGTKPVLSSEATSFGPHSAPTRIDAPAPQPAAPPREPAVPTLRDNAGSVPEDKSPDPALTAPEPVPELPEPSPPPEIPEDRGPPAVVRFVRAVVRFGLSMLVILSLGALLIAAGVVYILITPERDKERHDLESFLGRPAPAKSAIPGKASPSASAPVREHAEPATNAEEPPAPAAAEPSPSATAATPEDEPDKRADTVPAPSAEPTPAPENAAAPSAAAPEATPPPRPLGPAPDPWATVPRDLVRLVSKVNHGQGLSKREISSVHQFNAKRPDDPRGHLVLARGYLNRRWLKDAVNEYAVAMKVNEGARGDPRMLRDLIRIVEFGSSEGERLVREIYGSAALVPIDRALLESPNPEAKERLERLRGDISRS
jgi:serine/threonine-protein kinase